MPGKRYTLEERQKIEVLLKQKFLLSKIDKELERCAGSVSKEINRYFTLSKNKEYNGEDAHLSAIKLRKRKIWESRKKVAEDNSKRIKEAFCEDITNRALAQKLGLSVRTVSVHLTKLGLIRKKLPTRVLSDKVHDLEKIIESNVIEAIKMHLEIINDGLDVIEKRLNDE